MPNSLLLEQIDNDIKEAERLIAELRLQIALTQSAGADTSETEARLHRMLMVSMLLQDQRFKAAGQNTIQIEQAAPEKSVRHPSAGMRKSQEPEPNPDKPPANEDQP
jgi:hypothetical protein